MKVTRANEYWGIPDDDAPRRTAAPMTRAEVDDLLRGPRIHGGLLRWAEDKPGEVDDPSMSPGVIDRVMPDIKRLEHSLGNEGGSSPSDGSPERWPIILPGDKLMNAAGDVADSAFDAVKDKASDKKEPAEKEAKKTGRRRVALKDLWLRVAAMAPGDLYGTGKYLGTHDAEVHEDAQGQHWLVKPPRWDEHWPAHLDQATANLQQRAGLTTPEIQTVDWHGVPTPVHKMFPADDAFPGKRFDHSQLHPDDIMELQKHNVLDWLTSNHDAHPGQFIRHRDTGELVGIDKGQAFRYFGQDKLDPNFHPNANYGEVEPIYNTMWRNFANGKGHMNDPRQGELGNFIQGVQSIPDHEFQEMFRPYAQEAAAVGKLGTGGGLGPVPGLAPNDPEAFLSAITDRKNNLHNDFGNYYDQALAQRQSRVGHRMR